MNSTEIIKKLKQDGWFLHNVHGSHHQYKEKMNYPVVIHKDKDSDFGVTVPDLPGCFSAGETMEVQLDSFARKKGETRSGLFLSAAVEYISQHA